MVVKLFLEWSDSFQGVARWLLGCCKWVAVRVFWVVFLRCSAQFGCCQCVLGGCWSPLDSFRVFWVVVMELLGCSGCSQVGCCYGHLGGFQGVARWLLECSGGCQTIAKVFQIGLRGVVVIGVFWITLGSSGWLLMCCQGVLDRFFRSCQVVARVFQMLLFFWMFLDSFQGLLGGCQGVTRVFWMFQECCNRWLLGCYQGVLYVLAVLLQVVDRVLLQCSVWFVLRCSRMF